MPATDPLRGLLDAAAEGDDTALGELVRRTQPAVWRLCALLGSDGNEEDLVQETYLRAMRSLGSFRGDAPVQSWLLAIARHTCADDVRARERQRRLARRLSRERHDPGPASTSTEALVADLEPDRRDAFVLTQLLGLSYEEAGAALGCPTGTIRSRVARARADLLDMVRRAEAL
ncbi:MAG TPA: sigma-70 family RNA polymerase sigma factor [Acidimicrobiales bacterium]